MNKIMLVYLILTALVLTLFPFPMEKDFYDYHVAECNYAHSLNKTFAVCSGFMYEPRNEDLENPCAIHPIEPCETHVMHGSNTGQVEHRPIINIFNIKYD